MPNQPIVEVIAPPGAEQLLECAACSRTTSHKVLTAVEVYRESPDGSFQCWDNYWTAQCLGCKSISFCNKTQTSDEVGHNDEGEPFLVPSIKLYPSRLAGRRMPDWAFDLPHDIYRLFSEVHAALCNNLNILAGIGIRAIVEAVCKHKELKQGNLEKKIDELATAGAITTDGAEILHSLRCVGNASAHEAKSHKSDELKTAMDVVDHLLLGVYVLPKEAKKLPQRKSSSKKSA